MRPWVKALNKTVDMIKKLAKFRDLTVGEKEIAEKMGMTEAEFRACLSGESKVPKKLMLELWPAYRYLLAEHGRAEKRWMLRDHLALLQKIAVNKGVAIADDEIARRVGVSLEALKAYLDGSVEVPDGFAETFLDAFSSDVLKGLQNVMMQSVKIIVPLDLSSEDEL